MSGIYGRTVNVTGGATHDATHIMNVNGSDVVNDSHVGISNWLHHNDGQPDVIKYKYTFTISNISAGTVNAYMEIHNDSETKIHSKQWTGLSAGTYSYTLTWNWVDSLNGGGYSYLEQLHKLDGKSKAQYIPSRKN